MDAETGDVIKRRGGLIVEDIGTIPVTITYSDFDIVNGIRMPNKVNLFNPMSGNLLIEYSSIDTNQSFDKNVFTLSEE